LTFGINKGYAAFRNHYKTTHFDIDVKFKLNSQFDYYAIESIYQFVFNGKTDNETFDYIDDWCPRAVASAKHSGYDTYQILDKTIRLKKKPSTQNPFDSVWQDSSNGEIFNNIVDIIRPWVPPFATINTQKASRYIEEALTAPLKVYVQAICEKVIKVNEQSVNEKLSQKDQEIQTLQNELVKLRQIGKKAQREQSLKRLKGKELRDVAKAAGIRVSKLKVAELVTAILRKEFH
jgi:hypothetical protein